MYYGSHKLSIMERNEERRHAKSTEKQAMKKTGKSDIVPEVIELDLEDAPKLFKAPPAIRSKPPMLSSSSAASEKTLLHAKLTAEKYESMNENIEKKTRNTIGGFEKKPQNSTDLKSSSVSTVRKPNFESAAIDPQDEKKKPIYSTLSSSSATSKSLDEKYDPKPNIKKMKSIEDHDVSIETENESNIEQTSKKDQNESDGINESDEPSEYNGTSDDDDGANETDTDDDNNEKIEKLRPDPFADLHTTTTNSIEATSQICSILMLAHQEANKQMVIDYFQRPYAWEQRHCRRLVEDLHKAFKDQSSPFLGVITLANRKNQKNSAISILDGQQRLTTLTMLVAIVRFMLSKNSEKNPSVVHKAETFLFVEPEDPVGSSRPRLLVNKSIEAIFKTYIYCESPIPFDSIMKKNLEEDEDIATCNHQSNIFQQRVASNIQEMLGILSEKFKEKDDELKSFLSFMLNAKCLIVHNVGFVGNAEMLRSLFVSINDTGLPLSDNDKLKTHVLGKAFEYFQANKNLEEFDKLQEKWELLSGQLAVFKCAYYKDENEYYDGYESFLRLFPIFLGKTLSTDYLVTLKEYCKEPEFAAMLLKKFLDRGYIYQIILSCSLPKSYFDESTFPKKNEIQTLLKLFVSIPKQYDSDWQVFLIEIIFLCFEIKKPQLLTSALEICFRWITSSVFLEKKTKSKAIEKTLRKNGINFIEEVLIKNSSSAGRRTSARSRERNHKSYSATELESEIIEHTTKLKEIVDALDDRREKIIRGVNVRKGTTRDGSTRDYSTLFIEKSIPSLPAEKDRIQAVLFVFEFIIQKEESKLDENCFPPNFHQRNSKNSIYLIEKIRQKNPSNDIEKDKIGNFIMIEKNKLKPLSLETSQLLSNKYYYSNYSEQRIDTKAVSSKKKKKVDLTDFRKKRREDIVAHLKDWIKRKQELEMNS